MALWEKRGKDAPVADTRGGPIIVPTIGRPFSARALEIACRLAQGNSELLFVYFTEVPRALSLEAQRAEEELEAQIALEDAQSVSRQAKIQATIQTRRTRDAVEAIVKMVTEESASLIVLGAHPGADDGLPAEITRDLFFRVPCEVVVDYVPTRPHVASA